MIGVPIDANCGAPRLLLPNVPVHVTSEPTIKGSVNTRSPCCQIVTFHGVPTAELITYCEFGRSDGIRSGLVPAAAASPAFKAGALSNRTNAFVMVRGKASAKCKAVVPPPPSTRVVNSEGVGVVALQSASDTYQGSIGWFHPKSTNRLDAIPP